MKHLLKVVLFGLSGIILISCGNKPEEAVKKYYTHFYKGEFDKAKEYAYDEEGKGVLDVLKGFMPEDELKRMNQATVEVSNIECEKTNDTLAICSCQIVVTSGEERDTVNTPAKLVKKGSKWLVVSSKEDLFGGGEKKSADLIEEEIEIDEEIIIEME